MARFIVQSRTTGRFLCPTGDGGVEWVRSLRDAGGGVIADEEMALQLVVDHADLDEEPTIVDLDLLGTAGGYTQ